jgi:2-polyprenyl-3-methyl-5-hydroxy-6-metoxy-1,4-benzoquinol methylase
VLTELQYRLLRRIAPTEPTHMSGSAFNERGKLRTLLGDEFLEQVRDRDVVDFGCGVGSEALELARLGARVFGLDVRESVPSAPASGPARKDSLTVADSGSKCESPPTS